MAIKQPHKMIEAWLNQFDMTPKELLKLIESADELNPESDRKHKAVIEGLKVLEEQLNLPKTQLQAKYTLFLVELQAEYEKSDESLSEAAKTALAAQDFSPETAIHLTGDEDGVDSLAHYGFASEELVEQFKSKGGAQFYVRLTRDAVKDTPQLKASAKAPGYRLKLEDRGQHLLFRLINLAETFIEYDLDVIIRCDTSYLSDPDNRGVVQQFLNHYKQTGNSSLLNVRDFYPNDISGAKEAVLHFKNSFDATDKTEVTVGGGVIWSKGSKLRDQVVSSLSCVNEDPENSFVFEEDEIAKDQKPVGYRNAIAYINLNGVSVLEPLPRNGRKSLPVFGRSGGEALREDVQLDKLIALVALESIPEVSERYGGHVPGVLDQIAGYEGFIANALPLFLHGRASKMKDPGMGPNKTRVYNNFTPDSPEYRELIEKYMHIIDPEGIALIELAHEIWDDEDKTLYEYLEMQKLEGADDKDFIDDYLSTVKKAEEQLVKEYSGYLIG